MLTNAQPFSTMPFAVQGTIKLVDAGGMRGMTTFAAVPSWLFVHVAVQATIKLLDAATARGVPTFHPATTLPVALQGTIKLVHAA
jgi:hypothetical protein